MTLNVKTYQVILLVFTCFEKTSEVYLLFLQAKQH